MLTSPIVHIIEDDAAAVARLIGARGPQFDHTLAQLREEHSARQAYAEAVAAYADKGYTVLEQRPQWSDPTHVGLRYLRTTAGEDAGEADVTNPAHWAVVLAEDTALVDRETGQPVADTDVDWSTEDDPRAQPADGYRHHNTVVETTVYEPEWYCLDYVAAGLRLVEHFRRWAEPTTGDTPEPDSRDTDTDAARLQVEAEAAEHQRRERRKILALNKLGEAAIVVRREFVRTLLARKTPPKGAAMFIAECLTRNPRALDDGIGIAADLLGTTDLRKAVHDLGTGGDVRAQVITLGLLLAAMEGRTPKDAWRGFGGDWSPLKSDVYLKFLAAQGYTLSRVEQVVTCQAAADDVYDEYLAAKEATA